MSLDSIGLNWDRIDAILTGLQYLAMALPVCGLMASITLLIIEFVAFCRRDQMNESMDGARAAPDRYTTRGAIANQRYGFNVGRPSKRDSTDQ